MEHHVSEAATIDLQGLKLFINPTTSQLEYCQSNTMFSLQRFVVSALLILTITFVFFAQGTEAAKGKLPSHGRNKELLELIQLQVLRSPIRSTSTLSMAISHSDVL